MTNSAGEFLSKIIVMQIHETTNIKVGDNILLTFNKKPVIGTIEFVNKKANVYKVKLDDNSYYIGTFKRWVQVTKDAAFNLEKIFKKIIT